MPAASLDHCKAMLIRKWSTEAKSGLMLSRDHTEVTPRNNETVKPTEVGASSPGEKEKIHARAPARKAECKALPTLIAYGWLRTLADKLRDLARA